jgi:hypothetical protein
VGDCIDHTLVVTVELDKEPSGHSLDVERLVDCPLIRAIVAVGVPGEPRDDLDVMGRRQRRANDEAGDRDRPAAAAHESRADDRKAAPRTRPAYTEDNERLIVKPVYEAAADRLERPRQLIDLGNEQAM